MRAKSRHFTHDEFIEELKKSNDSVKVIGKFQKMSETVEVECLKCHKTWIARPRALLSGKQHPCHLRFTHDDFVSELSKINPNIKIIGRFTKKTDKIKVQCLKCERVYETRATLLLQGYGCKECGSKKQRLSQEEFLSRVSKDVRVLGEYEAMSKRIKAECLICGNIWESTAYSLSNGTGCLLCGYEKTASKRRLTVKKFKDRLHTINPNVEVLEDYVNSQSKIKTKCKICSKIFFPTAGSLLSGHGCPTCGIEKIRQARSYTHEEFVNKLSKINPDIEVVGKYIGSKIKIEFKCKKCGNLWMAAPEMVSGNGSGCPACAYSKGEDSIARFLAEQNIAYETQKKFDGLLGTKGGKLSYDFYIPQDNILIEFQGKQHYEITPHFGGEERFIQQQEHDHRKRDYALSHNYTLIEIPYYDFDNIEQILNEKLIA